MSTVDSWLIGVRIESSSIEEMTMRCWVTMATGCFSEQLIENETHAASTTTATPVGWTASVMATAICFVRRSCTGTEVCLRVSTLWCACVLECGVEGRETDRQTDRERERDRQTERERERERERESERARHQALCSIETMSFVCARFCQDVPLGLSQVRSASTETAGCIMQGRLRVFLDSHLVGACSRPPQSCEKKTQNERRVQDFLKGGDSMGDTFRLDPRRPWGKHLSAQHWGKGGDCNNPPLSLCLKQRGQVKCCFTPLSRGSKTRRGPLQVQNRKWGSTSVAL